MPSMAQWYHLEISLVCDLETEFLMHEPVAVVEIAMRIPGQWAHPGELLERLPEGVRLTPEALILADGAQVEFGAMPADDRFPQIFRSSCRQPPTEDELMAVAGYTVNVLLSGRGGSLDAARTMMLAAAAIIQAGGAGVFIDNCTLAHGGKNWLVMAEDGGTDALSFAYVGIVRGKMDVWTMGMHSLGLREVVMKRADADAHDFDIIAVIRYLASGEKPIEDGHVLADLNGPRYRTLAEDSPDEYAGSPMHNPFGRLKLVNVRDIAEAN